MSAKYFHNFKFKWSNVFRQTEKKRIREDIMVSLIQQNPEFRLSPMHVYEGTGYHRGQSSVIQEVFHDYLNRFENAVTHLILVIFGNN